MTWSDGDLLTPTNLNDSSKGSDTVTVTGDSSTRSTRASAVQNAINRATNNNKSFVFVPESFTNYDASAVTFDNSVRMVREGQVGDVYDVKAYGAAGDGATDDTQAFRDWFAAVAPNGNPKGRGHWPAGDYLITDTLTFGPVVGLVVTGAGNAISGSQGTRIRCEIDDATKHLFDVSDTRQCVWQDFHVIADEASAGVETVDAIFRSANNGVSGFVPTANIYRNIRIEGQGVPGGFKRGWFFDGSGTAGDANNDLNSFYDCHCQNPTEEGWLIDHSQSKTHLFLQSTSSGGKHIIRSSGSYRFYGGAGGGSTSAAAFMADAATDNVLIDGFNLEGCDRLYEQDAATTAGLPVVIRGGRFATNGLNADGDIVVKKDPGSLIFEGNLISGGGGPTTFKIQYGGTDAGAHVRIAGNRFSDNRPTDSLFSTLRIGDGNNDIVVQGNTFDDEAGGTDGVGLIADGDATPNVQGNHIFKTQNTDATTITDFDNGWYGKEIKVIIGDDNTTIDFTGTSLKGNAGVDWSPVQNDHMTCVYDGTNWYCDISDNTA